MTYPIEKCKTCERFNHSTGKFRNKLRCMVDCEEYREYQSIKMFEYNRAVSDDNFDTEVIYEHSQEVFGSGWKGKNK